jgi:hypothetical protein
MRLSFVQFVNVVNFGGSIQSANDNPNGVGDRPGAGGTVIELDDAQAFVKLTRTLNGKPTTRYVPMSNIATFEVKDVPAPAPAKK